ncbi:MAG: putative pyridoxine 5'-phosphate oxidase superfamily flavin-nucleotide-binding protein [Gammaproteobacteria bacterium]|jgi:predicted pyridoxine 5'-phosphate oxidase superfamily flavin-nucleotide-binding protein
MSSNKGQSPFHRGEQEIQNRVGVRERVEKIGNVAIRDHMPDQHRAFYAQLPFVFIGALDRAAAPWASMLFGRPGFIESPDSRSLEIHTSMVHGDPLHGELVPGAALGLLGIEYETRRRNRLGAQIVVAEANRLSLRVVQSFGNCPQYIQARSANVLNDIDSLGGHTPSRFTFALR